MIGKICWGVYTGLSIPLALLSGYILICCVKEIPNNFHQGVALGIVFSVLFITIWAFTILHNFRRFSKSWTIVISVANIGILLGLLWFGIEIQGQAKSLPLVLYVGDLILLAVFAAHLKIYSECWDSQIDSDVNKGKLDGLATEALADCKVGETKEL